MYLIESYVIKINELYVFLLVNLDYFCYLLMKLGGCSLNNKI